MTGIKNVQSQEKFYYFFIVIVVALLGAAVQTVKFESLGKYGIMLELSGWLFLMLSLVVAFWNAWYVQHLFFQTAEADRARTILEQKNIDSEVLITAVSKLDRLNSVFAELEQKFARRFKWQMVFFTLGIFCIASARSLTGVIMLKTLWQLV